MPAAPSPVGADPGRGERRDRGDQDRLSFHRGSARRNDQLRPRISGLRRFHRLRGRNRSRRRRGSRPGPGRTVHRGGESGGVPERRPHSGLRDERHAKRAARDRLPVFPGGNGSGAGAVCPDHAARSRGTPSRLGRAGPLFGRRGAA
ncbi:hypothetical protein GBAR_LOCUS1402 [Geodia barretti]|uniref:Uncharacterized protein n=1 Tax=Geodia barretti TaxID=519541 RepID=A0AA35QWJ6_GEOBA|nr:hypothetical protein GBAR_LOCUS1402 [Geodia barretti]